MKNQYKVKVLVVILGVEKAMVGEVFLSFLAFWATLGAQSRPKATKVDQRATKRRPKSTQRAPKATKVEPKGAQKGTKVGQKGVLEGPKEKGGYSFAEVG